MSECYHDICLMEAALHESGKCTEYDQIVIGVYCPRSVCALNRRHATLPADYGRLEPAIPVPLKPATALGMTLRGALLAALIGAPLGAAVALMTVAWGMGA